ncbi:hypothetical protein BCR41DRAFT_370053 [Lobosporangium transversale]|uniref:DUF788-domain-containing protein n=1 Tax=Lobosporangium transversale TaxID=64571 RepID=A0A1Y2GPM8_9FUNG|nr:hypothetical protein BCR41DRAFT_370053 [Lobosporangium transversale]ORZ18239.1 hypothetical protein BCR41DRAFT_370053 [Lobosporangium transversale]|eukprot:XP_021882034.1 hypothetical protein BCR41DRAFT_370053 [Lobosporangium transversale]
MANSSQKKIAHENAKALLSLRKGFIWVNAFYIFYRIIYNWSTFGLKLGFGYIATAGLSIFLYTQINAMGRPRYNSRGELADAGQDLSQEGLVQYAFDIIYVTWFVHVTSAFWSKMWWFYLSIPAYAGWKAWQLAVKPMLARSGMGVPSGAAEASGSTEGTKSKRREKMEKRAEKGPQVRYR